LLIAAVFCGFLGTWAVRRVAIRLGVLSYPNQVVREIRPPVPYLGGIGVLLGASVALILFGRGEPIRLTVFAGFVAFILLGLIDDLVEMRWWTKLSAQFAIAGVATVAGFLRGHPGMYWQITGWTPLDAVVSCVWLVTVVNAVNLIDVSDGLAASICAVVLMCWGLFAESASSSTYLAVAGACLGFLWWNWPSARIYLGDCGSQALGFLLGVAALDGFLYLPASKLRILVPILCTGVPLFELIFLTVVRIRKGLPWWRGSPDHFALRLQQAGLKKSQIALLAAWAAFGLWVSGMMIARATTPNGVLYLVFLLVGMGICWKTLLTWEVKISKHVPVVKMPLSSESVIANHMPDESAFLKARRSESL
jgi:UDP-GlcNAc:undecaprenyl-phosphate/decaprenyl-phosphate GlcNAc-1-phosphate transferase